MYIPKRRHMVLQDVKKSEEHNMDTLTNILIQILVLTSKKYRVLFVESLDFLYTNVI